MLCFLCEKKRAIAYVKAVKGPNLLMVCSDCAPLFEDSIRPFPAADRHPDGPPRTPNKVA